MNYIAHYNWIVEIILWRETQSNLKCKICILRGANPHRILDESQIGGRTTMLSEDKSLWDSSNITTQRPVLTHWTKFIVPN